MIEKLLKPEVQQFIRDHEPDDPGRLMLQAKKFSHLPLKEIVQQIQGRQKAKAKLPAWYNTEGVVFPPPLAMEQCSSEPTARYKASLLKGDHLIDLTGGAGVDTFYLSPSFRRVTYVEKDSELAQLSGHNFKMLGATDIDVIEALAEDYLKTISKKADVIYLDPARRGKQGQKVFTLSDCSPDVLEIRDNLLQKATQVMLKTSPMLDITRAISELSFAGHLHVVAVNNEVKEVLYILGQTKEQDPEITAVNIIPGSSPQQYTFSLKEEQAKEVSYSTALQYLYEPNKAVLKAGAFKSVANTYGLFKLHPNSHLYTSRELVGNFPGRVFALEATVPYKKKALQPLLPSGKASITARNFPDSVREIRKKTGLQEGGDKYLFATTDMDDKLVLLLTSKVNLLPLAPLI